MTRLSVILLVIVAVATSCDPVKRAMRRKAKVDRIIADYLLDNPLKADTIYLPGVTIERHDTIVNENIYVDTIKLNDTLRIYSTRWRDIVRHVNVTDTIWIRPDASGPLRAMQAELDAAREKIEQQRAKTRQISIGAAILSLLLLIVLLVVKVK
jgi:hypothetical protein